jgi:hypothetical protein
MGQTEQQAAHHDGKEVITRKPFTTGNQGHHRHQLNPD